LYAPRQILVPVFLNYFVTTRCVSFQKVCDATYGFRSDQKFFETPVVNVPLPTVITLKSAAKGDHKQKVGFEERRAILV
jgi:hypothetical protein